ncbi:MAG: DUF1045 domain-containing protein [Hyphomicrobiaceae bacterium]
MIRYAVYLTPAADTALWAFGSQAVGYDSVTGEALTLPDSPFHCRPDAMALTEEPRRYGFHGTLKAPFELAEAHTEEELLTAARVFARARTPFEVPAMTVKALSRFVALVPAAPSAELAGLAADCVTAFEPFRAPLTEADLARRLRASLSEPQRAHLARWGYPYVFDEFRFHMTLTGPIEDDAVRAGAARSLAALYESIDGPMTVDAITIEVQPARDHRFRVLERIEFG